MTKIDDLNYEEREQTILIDRYKVPEIYADGVSQILMGYPTVKLTLHSVLESREKEIRKACAVLTMDAPSALDMAFEIIEAFRQVKTEMLQTASTTSVEKLKKFLDRIPEEDASNQKKTKQKK